MYENYRAKMKNFKHGVDRFYEDSEIENALKEAKSGLETTLCKIESFGTKEHRERLTNGQIHKEMETILKSLTHQEEGIKAELSSLDKMILEENEKRIKVKQGTEMMQKRNAAQLTRIKRQLQEGSTRTRTLEEEILKLENRINHMKSTLIG
ncbi:uncharacterized protein LOC135687064 [Rhopilema esculentum]|uniref:uncharacterized protein LOC135687064 n=1 Tax=Rhopilema esculentum TaxID=499914 RepID=UPI0031CDB269